MLVEMLLYAAHPPHSSLLKARQGKARQGKARQLYLDQNLLRLSLLS